MTKLEKAARVALRQCLAVSKNESVLILADEPLMDTAKLLWKAALDCKAYAMLLQIPAMSVRDTEPPEAVSKLMCEVDVVIAPTSRSISHTKARRKANRAGTRIVTMPSITQNTFARIKNIDFIKCEDKSRKIADILTIGREAILTSVNGTSLKISIHKKVGYADTGLVLKSGQFSNLPAGEACIAPILDGTEGILVVDSGMCLEQKDNEKITITFKCGRAIRIKGNHGAERLRKELTPYSPKARSIAELGVGTNDAARLCWESLEDEKVAGTVHIALGNNVSFGGNNNVPIHIDGVVHKPTLEIDGRIIVKNGKLVLN